MGKHISIIVLFFSLLLVAFGCSSLETEVENGDSQLETNKIESPFIDGKVVTIDGHTFDERDLQFHTLMNKVIVILEKAANETDADRYDEQLDYYDYVNANLQTLIELYSMTLLAEEKHYFIPDEKLIEQKNAFRKKVDRNEEARELIQTYGEELYGEKLDEYVRQIMLRDRIVEDLEKEIAEENPHASNQEVSYLLENKFNDLYMAQMATLEVEIHVN